MDDEQQAWWTSPPGAPAPGGPATSGAPREAGAGAKSGTGKRKGKSAGRAGPPEDPIELIVDERPATRPVANPRSLGLPLPPTAAPRSDGDPPTRPVEYLTVRLEPEPEPQPGLRLSGDTMDVPVAAMPRLRQAQPERPPSGFRRGPAIAIGVGVLLVIIAVAVIASKVATGAAPGSSGGSRSAIVSARAVRFPGTPPDSLTPVSGERAEALLQQSGKSVPGTVKQAFTWTDKNGQNLLVASAQRTSKGLTLRVLHVAELEGAARTLRTMTDPDLPECSAAGGGDSGSDRTGFTNGSIFVRDLNGDGVAEATIGWTARCAGSSKGQAKLALITGTDKYIIRGEGDIGSAGTGTRTPDPASSRWPARYLKPVTALYRALYF